MNDMKNQNLFSTLQEAAWAKSLKILPSGDEIHKFFRPPRKLT